MKLRNFCQNAWALVLVSHIFRSTGKFYIKGIDFTWKVWKMGTG